jgi:uncharacterized protein (UPF0335 family)
MIQDIRSASGDTSHDKPRTNIFGELDLSYHSDKANIMALRLWSLISTPDDSFDSHVIHLKQGLYECACWLEDLVLTDPRQRLQLHSAIRSSHSKLRRSITWVSGLVSAHCPLRDIQPLRDSLFTDVYLRITTCVILAKVVIVQRSFDFVVISKALSPLTELFGKLQEVQKVVSETHRTDDSDMTAEKLLSSPLFLAEPLHTSKGCIIGKGMTGRLSNHPADDELQSDDSRSGVSTISQKADESFLRRIERLEASKLVFKTSMAIRACRMDEHRSWCKFIGRTERLKASRAEKEVKIAFHDVLGGLPGMGYYKLLSNIKEIETRDA